MARRKCARLTEGGRIDRNQPLSFQFNGIRLQGYRGDTIASALLASGITVVSRSFKYHRPRGVFSAGVEETGALLRVADGGDDTAFVRATSRLLTEGCQIESLSGFPSSNFDFGRVIDFTHRLWPAGFYNKTFKWPNWRWYESVIRKATGLGNISESRDVTPSFHHNLHCDVLIVGAGPAGLAAAHSAASSGARIIVAEQDHECGGSLLSKSACIDGVDPESWVNLVLERLAKSENVSLMTACTVTGYHDHNVLTIMDRSSVGMRRYWKVRAKQVVLATGAIEQPLVFTNNDRPGIMLAGAAQAYVNRWAVRPRESMVVATNNDSAYPVAFDLQDRGVTVPAIIDARSDPSKELVREAAKRGIDVIAESVITNAFGSKEVTGVRIGRLTNCGQFVAGKNRYIACRGVAVSGGFSPTVHLYSQAGGLLCYEAGLRCFVPQQCRQRVRVAGSANGSFTLAAALAEGARAGSEGATDVGFPCSISRFSTTDLINCTPGAGRITPSGDTSRQWIDLLHDVTAADVELAVREGYESIEHMKRYTTTGMSVDQGKTSNLNSLTLLAGLTGRTIDEVGTTTFRPPYTPVPMAAIAGQRHGRTYAPARLLPAHDWHASHGAVFENYGAWKRPEYYAVGGSDRQTAIQQEALALRKSIGLFDGSALGKIEIKGPDAAEFLNRIYVNNALTLRTGRVRYGLMLNENGVIIDDGVFSRLSDDFFLVNTTAVNADRITAWLEEWHQCEWPGLELIISPVTSAWAVTTIAGPNSRRLLEALDSDIDFSPHALPHMSVTSGIFLGLPARVQRVSFSGELSFEISVPASHGRQVIETLFDAGGEHLTLAGIEALLLLRTEKGYLHVGTDTDGTTNALDVGFGAIVRNKQADFIGKRSLLRAHDQRANRRQFVGIEPLDADRSMTPGAHFVISENAGRRSEGFVTSACFSPTLRRSIGLGLLEGGFQRKGEVVTLFDQGRISKARVVDPVFYDPAGEKINV